MAEKAFEKILSTTDQGEVAILKSLLADAGFKSNEDFYFMDEYLSQYGAAIPAMLMVKKDLVGTVKELLKNGN